MSLITILLSAQVLVMTMANGVVNQGYTSHIDSLYFSPDAGILYIDYTASTGHYTTAYSTAQIVEMHYDNLTLGRIPDITWIGDSVSAINPMAYEGVQISADGADVTIHASHPAEVEYTLSGASNDGFIKIYSDLKFQFTLLGLDLTNTRGAAINSQTGKKFTLKMQNGYTNTLADGATYSLTPADEDEKATLFSEGQIIFKGKGTLNVSSQAHHAIKSDDYLSFENGVVNVTGCGTDYDGVNANDSILIPAGTLNISVATNGSKGINCDGLITIGAVGTAGPTVSVTTSGGLGSVSAPARQAGPGGGGGWPGGPGGGGPGGNQSTGSKPKGIKSDSTITMYSGTVSVICTGQGGECIESKLATANSIRLLGGALYAKSSQDDAINSAGAITFGGTDVVAISLGNDAIDSNYGRTGAITISGGHVLAYTRAGSPEEAFDCDNNSYLVLSGGVAAGFGGKQGGGSTAAGTGSTGYALSSTTLSLSTGRYYTLYDSSNSPLMTWSMEGSVSSALSLFVTNGATGSCSVKYSTTAPADATNPVPGLYLGGTPSATTNLTTFTAR